MITRLKITNMEMEYIPIKKEKKESELVWWLVCLALTALIVFLITL